MTLKEWDELLATDWLEPVRAYLDRTVKPGYVIPMLYDPTLDTVVLLVNKETVLPYMRCLKVWMPPCDWAVYFASQRPDRL